MGNRVLYQVVSGKEFSPVVYAHWSGYKAFQICKRLEERMKGRHNDVPYAAARLLQEVIGTEVEGNAGYAIWNADKVLTAEDSQGDAGVVIIDVSEEKHTYTVFGGYLKLYPDEYPKT
jgi:hypothetical protein